MKADESGHRSPLCYIVYISIPHPSISPVWHTTTLTLRYSYAFTCNPRARFYPPLLFPFFFLLFFPFCSCLLSLPVCLLSLISEHYQHRCGYLQRVLVLSNVSFTCIHVTYHKRAVDHAILIFASMIYLRCIIVCQKRAKRLYPQLRFP